MPYFPNSFMPQTQQKRDPALEALLNGLSSPDEMEPYAQRISPAGAERRMPGDEPDLPPTPPAFAQREPIPPVLPSSLDPSRVAPLLDEGQTVVSRAYSGEPMRGYADMRGGSPEQTQHALAGLQAAQGDQFSPFSEAEMTQLAARDPQSTAPGSGAYWSNMLRESQARRGVTNDLADKQQEAIQAGITGTHPAVQATEGRRAQNAAMPAMINARGQLEAAKEAGRSRFGAAQVTAQGRTQVGQLNHLDTIMNAIRTIQAKTNLGAEDLASLKALRALYDLYAQDPESATFEDALSPEE